MLLRYFYSFFFTILFLGLNSQTLKKKDSLLHVINISKIDTSRILAFDGLARYYTKIDVDSIKIFADSAWFLSKKINYLKGLQIASNMRGIYYNRVSDYKNAIQEFSLSLNFAKELKNEKEIAKQLFSIANVFSYQTNQPQALKFHLEALRIREKLKDSIGIAASFNSIGYVYKIKNEPGKALSYYFKAKNLFEKQHNQTNLASAYANIGGVYSGRKMLDSAIFYTKKSLEIRTLINDKKGLGHCYQDMGLIFEIKQDLKTALIYFNKSFAIKLEIGDKRGASNTLNSISSAYYDLKDYAKAKKYCNEALFISKEIGALELLTESTYLLSQIEEKLNNPTEALKAYKLFKKYADSTFNLEKMNDMTRKELEYEYDKKEAIGRSEQERKNTFAEEEKRKQKVITYTVSIGLIITFLFSLLIFNSLQANRKKSKIITAQKVVVDHKQKEILDSISYAKRLQEAILPPQSLLSQLFAESFILYKPKDIVAGDFYFIEKKGDHIFLAAADCTGHGVPGAMVSVVCSNALNRVIKEFDLIDAGKILDKTKKLVLETFSKSSGEVKDGMDISFLSVLKTNTGATINWSGANNPLWYIETEKAYPENNKENLLKEIKPDKQPIGKSDSSNPFTSHSIHLTKGSIIYLFTDGYVDQFGGQTNKKFKSKQLKNLLQEISAQNLSEQKEKLNTAFENWKGNNEQVDDICIIGFKII